MSMLTVAGMEMPILPGTQIQEVKHGDIGRAYSGKMRSDIKASHRVGRIAGSILDTDNDAGAMLAILNTPGPVLLGGTLLGDDGYFHVTNVVTSAITADRLKFDFQIAEADLSPSALLFSFDGDAPGQYTFSRTGTAPYVDSSGVLQSAATGIARVGVYADWLDLDGDGILDTPAYLGEPAATNDLLDSDDVDPDDANWGESASWTQAAATSVFQSNGVSQKFTNDGTASHYVGQSTPALVGTSVVASVIVENVDAVDTQVGIYDSTGGDWVVLGTYTWATGAMVDAGHALGSSTGVRAKTLAEAGPNGGKLVRLEIYGIASNPGNPAVLLIYPSGQAANSESAILHHAQHEDGIVATSPIQTDGTAVTRNADTLYGPFAHAPQAMTIYVKMREAGTLAAAANVLGISNATDPQFYIAVNSGFYAVAHDIGATASLATLAAAPSFGDLVELRGVLNADGSVTIGQSINSGTETTATDSATQTLQSAWASERIYIGSSGGSGQGLNPIISVKVVSGVRTMAEMRDWARARLWQRESS